MTLKETLKELEALGDAKVRAHNAKWGVGEKQYSAKLGDIRKIAAKIKSDDALAAALWETGNFDARMLAVLLLSPKKLTRAQLDRLVREADSGQLADWLTAYIVKKHADKESLRQDWMKDAHPWAARAGWALTSERIGKSPDGLDIPALLGRIESEMGTAPAPVQWTMNFCLAGIGIHFPKLRKRAIAISEKLGIYRDYPVSRGWISPFAPIWIEEMVKREA